MTELSDDILYNIFLKLPVKFIIRCRSVCKVWRGLLCDPNFVRMHTNQHQQSQEKLLFNNCTHSFYSLDYYEKTKGKAVRRDFPIKVRQHFLGSCNGLVWLGIQRGIRDEDWDTVLWNPSTADYKILPDPRPSFLDNYFEGKQLQGLGYCDDYKMLRLTYKCEDPRADVYTLKTNSWKKIIEDVSDDDRKIMYSNPHHTGIALNGCIYWLVIYQFNGRLNQMLLGFDIKREKFTELSLPPKASRDMNEHLTVIKGYLCISRVFRHGGIVMWWMRELDNKKKEWNNMMTISTQLRLGRKLYDMNKPLCWLMNGKILFYMGRKFAIYDPKSGILEESYHIDGIDGITDWVTFSESLFSPNTYEG